MTRAHGLTWPRIQLGVHLLVALLLGVVVVRAFVEDHSDRERLLLVAATALMAAVYCLGLTSAVRGQRWRSLAWLAALVACWVFVLALAPEGVYLAFPLFFLAAHLLTQRPAVLTITALTVVAVVGYAAQRGWSFSAVLGPVLGALVAIATVFGVRAVNRESERRGVLEERERLAREIHDTLAQGLTSIQLLLGAAGPRIGTDPTQAADLVEQAREVATANLEEARRFVRALAPTDLDTAPLDVALARVSADSGATFTVSGTPRALATAHDVALLRITQEALANAARHSGADRVAVTLSYLPDEVAVDVVDDGGGFDDTVRTAGFGLESMRSRARALGGTFTVESAPGAGTAIAVSLPEVAR